LGAQAVYLNLGASDRGAEMVAGCSTPWRINDKKMSLSRLWVAIEFIVPADCVAGAIVIWLDLPGSNPGGIASI